MFRCSNRQRGSSGWTRYSNFMSRGITDPQSAMHSAVVAVEKTIRSQATLTGYAGCRRIDEHIVRAVPE